ncbi:MAG: 23S rRNA (uracil(1939)-C(5))-methyltransferase RlmD [Betaproteobacteria bacterium]|nr:23S rRNA (uracil(1939)-C(5))-methyltransferase RlmD [Betaproteobacteria bacterium]
MQTYTIESLDQEGRGIARRDGKTIFIEGALTGEVVSASVYRKKPSFENARVERVLFESSQRVTPQCVNFGVCGGCSLQHLDARAQVAAKQRVLEDSLWHIGKVKAGQMLPPIHGPAWGYRRRARMSARYVEKKGGSLIGFHEKRSSFVADMRGCEVLPPHISKLLSPLRELVNQLSIRERMPQIEVACGDAADVLVFRVLEPPSAADQALLKAFAKAHQVRVYLQPKGPDTAHPLWPEAPADLYYALPEFDIKMPFFPTEFTQVNHAVNGVLVRRALSLLQPQAGERIADMFCGIGNFTLPIARSGAQVLGIEGSESLVKRAAQNAAYNGLARHTQYRVMNLFEIDAATFAALGRFDRMLIDPPRDGAAELVKALAAVPPQRIVYVSCNPATLARDASILVHEEGYTLDAAGVINMFPHTAHVESIALFNRAP